MTSKKDIQKARERYASKVPPVMGVQYIPTLGDALTTKAEKRYKKGLAGYEKYR